MNEPATHRILIISLALSIAFLTFVALGVPFLAIEPWLGCFFGVC
jgi:hypothetical protein